MKMSSEKKKEYRENLLMHPTTGRLSDAEVHEELREELGRSPSRVELFDACFTDANGDPSCDAVEVALGQMREHQSKLPQGSQDPISLADSYSKVMGKHPRGKVRMVGFGVNPSDIWGGIPSRSACNRMVLQQQATIERMPITNLEEKVELQQRPITNSETHSPMSPCQPSNSTTLGENLKVGSNVQLRSIFNCKKVVAIGFLRSMDPNQDVGGQKLGPNCVEVQINQPVEWDEELYRSYSILSSRTSLGS